MQLEPGEDLIEPLAVMLYLLLAPVWASVAGAVARRRGNSVFLWATLGFLFAIPAVICAALTAPEARDPRAEIRRPQGRKRNRD